MRRMFWKFFLQRAAHHYGLMDPVSFLARMRSFAQPSEVQEPIELLRAGIIFHSRGLLNTKAIQTNLDWLWPYWVQRQFSPDDPSFIPRAFSFSHVNLTHRNWTAVGHPDLPLYPIVDPRGLVTPLFDGWSLDFWIMTENGQTLLPSTLDDATQRWRLKSNLAMETSCHSDVGQLRLHSTVQLTVQNNTPVLNIDVEGNSPQRGWLVIALRPYNPEGIQFIEQISYNQKDKCCLVNLKTRIELTDEPEHVQFSNYPRGDIVNVLNRQNTLTHGSEAHSSDSPTRNKIPGDTSIECPVGMATGAMLYEIPASGSRSVNVGIPLNDELEWELDSGAIAGLTGKPGHDSENVRARAKKVQPGWASCIEQTAKLQVPDARLKRLYDQAVYTVLLLSADKVVPGPYTYFRFWFRDACLMMNALLSLGLHERVRYSLLRFPDQQKLSGYFRSQEGEWDSNGQVLWICDRYEQLSGRSLGSSLHRALKKGGRWIDSKRLKDARDELHAGLLPPGFSAEHFGPNDYYYWDDFWSIGGLRALAAILRRNQTADEDALHAREFDRLADALEAAVWNSIRKASAPGSGIPASPYRRMDSGAIGSMVADYPLQLVAATDEHVRETADFLIDRCFYKGGFFQDMIHSGINAYLTLDIAQTLLRQGDDRYRALIQSVAALATQTGQWPEAIHPQTGGGCMGDGQHGWAAAEWIMMMRNLFVREEGGRLIIGSGLFPEWTKSSEPVCFGPTLTPFGPVTVSIQGDAGSRLLTVKGDWRDQVPEMRVEISGYAQVTLDSAVTDYPLTALTAGTG